MFTYILLSECLGPKKCLRVVQGSITQTEHVSSAAWKCSKDNARLVSSRTCDDLHLTYRDIRNEKREYRNISFWIGNSSPGESQLGLNPKNWFNDSILDS